MKSLVSALALLGTMTVSAAEIDSLENAHFIPEIEAAQEKLEVTESVCPYGKIYTRFIEIKVRGRSEIFKGRISYKFQEGQRQQQQGDNGRQQQQHQQQCQQPQQHQVYKNDEITTLFYKRADEQLPERFTENGEEDIKDELLRITGEGSLLIVDGGSAWTKFQRLPYKSTAQDLSRSGRNIQVQYATNGRDVCLKRSESGHNSGTEKVFCLVQLAK